MPEDDKTGGAAGGTDKEQREPVPYNRFSEVVKERNDLRDKNAVLERDVKTHQERAATADTLASQLNDAKANHAKELAGLRADLTLAERGVKSNEDRQAVRFYHSQLPEKDRPELGTWLDELQKDTSKAPRGLGLLLQDLGKGAGDAGGAGKDAKGAGGGKETPEGKRLPGSKGRDDTGRGGTGEVSTDEIRAAREKGQKTGDWSDYEAIRATVLPGARPLPKKDAGAS